MSKFVASKCVKFINEDGDYVVSFTVKGADRIGVNLAFEEQHAEKNKIEKDVEVDMKLWRSKRSLEQNAALWFLLTKLADAMSGNKNRTSTEEVYCIMLEEANVVSDYMLALPEAEPMLRKSFRAIRKVDEREVNGKTLNMYQYFIGSSKYNTAEMTELIKNTLLKLDELGVVDSEIENFRRKYEKQKK